MKRDPKSYNIFKEDFCEVCGHDGSFYPLDPDHVKTFGSGGPCLKANIMTLCRLHHIEKGQKGINHMAETYPSYKAWLKENNWDFCEFNKKWKLKTEEV